jgi:hypothetical protein
MQFRIVGTQLEKLFGGQTRALDVEDQRTGVFFDQRDACDIRSWKYRANAKDIPPISRLFRGS